MTLKEWTKAINRMEQLQKLFAVAGGQIDKGGLDVVAVNVTSEDCMVLCDVLATMQTIYNRGNFVFKG